MKTIVSKTAHTTLQSVTLNHWHIHYYTQKASYKDKPNEDAILVQAINDTVICVAVADGVGSTRDSFQASAGLLDKISTAIQPLDDTETIRHTIASTIDTVNHTLIKNNGPATTLTLALLSNETLYVFQIGDSGLFVCGQRGKLHYRTTMHSPTGYAIAAGLLTEKQAQNHPHNNIVDNVVGTPDMQMQMTTGMPLHRYDTIFLATDGIFDNFTTDQLIPLIQKRHPQKALTDKLITPCQTLLDPNQSVTLQKDDDISFIVVQR